MTTHHTNNDIAAKKIIDHVGKNIVIGVPVGIGKPIGLLNALYRLAIADKSISLTIITGLTLARPILHNTLEKNLVEPILDRLLKDFEDPLYEKVRVAQQLPDNIKVIEFFLTPGKYLHNNYVQQNYISSNYASVLRDALYYSINVIAQQVAYSNTEPKSYSLSCNSDSFHDTVQYLKKSTKDGEKIAIVAEVNTNLPFMYGADAVINTETFTDIIDTGHYPTLFPIPREELAPQDHLIGLYASCLIKDGGCLQIGIGKLSNALASALILRQQKNNVYSELMQQLLIQENFAATLSTSGSLTPFDLGLYASTEMLSDEYIQLYNVGLLKKRVYDHIGLQKLLNTGEITETIQPNILDVLLAHKIIHAKLTQPNIKFLLKFGILKSEINHQDGYFILSSGEKIVADLSLPLEKQKIIEQCLGTHLKLGKIIHAGFFLGSADFYQQLRDLSSDELQQIEMCSIARTNTLSWSPKLLTLQRQQARFINSAMMLTLGGGIVSDGLKDLREVSGVGGQFDFINMAHTLDDARSIIMCRSTRTTNKGVESNIVWDYPNLTIPRYLRDIVITEYGIADCRSKTDAEIIKALLNVTDSRFQPALLAKAKQYGMLPKNYAIPKNFQHNYPHVIEPIIHNLQSQGYCPPYPFGSDLTDEENLIQHALLFLKNCLKLKLLFLMVRSLFFFNTDTKLKACLLRMKLDRPQTLKEFLYKKLLAFVINRVGQAAT